MNIISEFSDNKGLNVKLTADKIFISAVGIEETFALRSVQGIGIYDDIVKYNSDLEKIKSENATIDIWSIGLLAISSFVAITVILNIPSYIASNLNLQEILNKSGVKIFLTLLFIALSFYVKRFRNKTTPLLDSYLSIILSGGDRKFRFNKDEVNAKNVAEFVNKVEETLTAYHSK
jgi:hypothetical protein